MCIFMNINVHNLEILMSSANVYVYTGDVYT